MQQRNIILPGQ